MSSCDPFEMAIEMRLHGALARAEEDDLAAHLATCASCQGFERLAKGTETAMTERTATHLETIDWDALLRRTITFVERQSRQRLAVGALVVAATIGMMLVMGFPALSTAGETLATGCLLLAVFWVKSRRKLANARGAREDTGELLFFYRRELEDRLRATTMTAVLVPSWLVVSFLLIFRPYLVSPHAWAGFLGLCAVMLSIAAYAVVVRRPRIQRELDALKADVKR
jgi:hypothetical protein